LVVGEVPGVFQPDIAGLGHQFLVGFALFPDLIPIMGDVVIF